MLPNHPYMDSPKIEKIILRPGVANPALWYPERPSKKEWDGIRKTVLERDDFTCCACGHRALKYMNVHHLNETGENSPGNLATICVACHAILHMGRNLDLQTIEIWKAAIPQIEIVRRTRDGIKNGLALAEINKSFQLKRGPHAPNSLNYANGLIAHMGEASRASLNEPLCAVFVNFSRWQLE